MSYPIHGKIVRADKNGVNIANTTKVEWEATVNLDDISAQGAHWKSWLPGMGEWGGTISVLFDPSNTEQKALMDNIVAATPGTKLSDVKIELEDSDDYLSGDIFITNFPISASIGGKVTCSFGFKGDGAPSLTIA